MAFGAKFNHAMQLFNSLGTVIRDWEEHLPREEAQTKLRQLLRDLTPEDFELIENLLTLLQSAAGQRLFGLPPAAFAHFDRELEEIRLARKVLHA